MLREYLGADSQHRKRPVTDLDSLANFLDTRASHVAQTSLYGYLRTRAGTRFPELFENPDILESINIAKWHIWLACVADLAQFTGQCLYRHGELDQDGVRGLMAAAVLRVLDDSGEPDEAGPDFGAARDKLLQRIETRDWSIERDDDSLFNHSPDALFYWSPVADELKENDELIVKNSIRFRWIEVRRNARKLLDLGALSQVRAAPAG